MHTPEQIWCTAQPCGARRLVVRLDDVEDYGRRSLADPPSPVGVITCATASDSGRPVVLSEPRCRTASGIVPRCGQRLARCRAGAAAAVYVDGCRRVCTVVSSYGTLREGLDRMSVTRVTHMLMWLRESCVNVTVHSHVNAAVRAVLAWRCDNAVAAPRKPNSAVLT